MVRHWILVPAFAGSNPATPAMNLLTTVCVVYKFIIGLHGENRQVSTANGGRSQDSRTEVYFEHESQGVAKRYHATPATICTKRDPYGSNLRTYSRLNNKLKETDQRVSFLVLSIERGDNSVRRCRAWKRMTVKSWIQEVYLIY